MGIPQYLMLAFILLKLGASVERHNKPKVGSWHCAADFMHVGILLLLLLLGGFFNS